MWSWGEKGIGRGEGYIGGGEVGDIVFLEVGGRVKREGVIKWVGGME